MSPLVLVLCLMQPDPPAAVKGYIDSRLSRTQIRNNSPVPKNGVPSWTTLEELNVELRLRFHERALAHLDTSFVYQRGFLYGAQPVDRSAQTPGTVISELYGLYHFTDHLNLTLGRKRVIWGPAQVVSPMDILNPPKDPTDPTSQRAGAWLARLEAPFERFSLTGIFAARAFQLRGGMPTGLVYDPGDAQAGVPADPGAHFLLAGRIYALIRNTDFNAVYYLTHRYADSASEKSRLGLSVSRLLGSALEVHFESLIQRGPSAPHPSLSPDDAALRLVAGPRYTFADDAMLGAEYFWNGEGRTAAELATGISLVGQLQRTGMVLPTAAGDLGTPQKFSFNPLGRHYLLLTYTKPHIRDDFSVQVTALVSATDGSSLLAPIVMWSVREWLSLSLAAFVTAPGIPSRRLQIPGGNLGEFEISPISSRFMFSGRAFF